jgi:AcrR family transcriptional regulator
MSESTTRQHIVAAADRLFYRQGYAHTSFSDIADAVRISRGNFYHHFKSKDEILDAVIDQRLAATGAMLGQWESDGTEPADRIGSFIQMLIANRADIERFGCPVGTLCGELAKLDHAAQGEATKVFELFRTWLRRQFALLGRADADALAMHLLARSQGIAALATAFRDEAFIRHEVAQLHDWLKSCAAVPDGRDVRRVRTPARRRRVGQASAR